MSDDNNEWEQPDQPPPQLFTGDKEENFQKQISDELIERVIGQHILYFPIDIKNTEYHPVYGEAVEKNFLDPIRVPALVDWEGISTSHEDDVMFDKTISMSVHFPKRRLTEDRNLYVKTGDFLLYGERYYEIHSTEESRQTFGKDDNRLEIVAHCIKAREGVFKGE